MKSSSKRTSAPQNAKTTLPLALQGPLARRWAGAKRAARKIRYRSLPRLVRLRRCLDVLMSGIGLVALSPLLGLTIVLVKTTSRGPAFFRQERVGQYGRPFGLWKFRTMYTDAEHRKSKMVLGHHGIRFKLKRDPRVTPVGRWLRKLSIDELPQLWNVFVGHMTLIGPRPPIWREVDLYSPMALRRLEVTPGLTCFWQVGGRSDLTFEEQVALDVNYIDTATLQDEIKILVKTIPAVITGRGAY